MGKFTGGEWRVVRWSECEDGEQPPMTGDCFVQSSITDVCYLAQNTGSGGDETEADATLIAASKDMFEALKDLIFTASKLWDDAKPIKDTQAMIVTHPIIEEAKSVVCKAEGKPRTRSQKPLSYLTRAWTK